MSLTSLPTEILHQVIDDLLPEGLESIALTCKALYQVSSTLFAFHRRMRDRYEHFSYSKSKSVDGVETWDSRTEASGIKIRHAADLLQRIAEDPRVARYIRFADFKADASIASYPSPMETLEGGSVLDRLAENVAMMRLVRESTWPYLRDAGLDPQALPEKLPPVVDTLVLLTMLPNVRQLALPRYWGSAWDMAAHYNEFLDGVLGAVLRRANEADHPHPGASLSRLSIIAPHQGSGYDTHDALELYDPFLALNSLREFYMGSMVAETASANGASFSPSHDKYSPQLKKIELVASVMGRPEWVRLLSRTPNLEILRMSHENKFEWLGQSWDLGETMNTIQQVAGKHLRELCLSASNCWSTGTTLTNMSGFECLEVLELDVSMLLQTAYEDDGRGGDDTDGEDMDWMDRLEALDKEPKHTSCLVDILPASIQTVRLVGWGHPTPLREYEESFRAVKTLFRWFALERPSKLPALKEISFTRQAANCMVLPEYKEVLDYLEREGCTIVDPNACWAIHLKDTFYERFGVEADY
ncbi:uncharacterized protein E0L32_002837 [Thyridium curvatum]|uniref:F-box domain-containing protein n=1 Tax=Thyridium curvatum TaxID=1093900 RepID=A0A507BEI9_9PEZI|nr:uncharacterized protein E0L32_002837 [Thyridium curvatum]TPX17736.1 hypothetical protein E0L32_002837 [Thyridium curvatum]